MDKKIQKLFKSSKVVFKDCLLPNGCLVAAPSHMPYYPKFAKKYLQKLTPAEIEEGKKFARTRV